MAANTRPPLSVLGEFGLIRRIEARFGRTGPLIFRGIGDDAAVIRTLPGRHLVVTTDLLIEGIHFDLRLMSPLSVGYKAAVANLSDIAAMGGIPQYLLVSLAIPASGTVRDIEQLYEGMMEAGRPYHLQLIGGDTSASRHGLFISLTLLGSVPSSHALTRDGARVGDLVFVTGMLGDAQAGLDLLLGRSRSALKQLPVSHRRYLIDRHLRPSPRVQAAQVLSSMSLASAAIDLSDGLAGDLGHLCERSGVGAEIEMVKLPCSDELRAYAQFTGQDPADLALTGGEDYELLFTVHHRDVPMLRRLHRRLGCRVSPIGVIQPKAFGLKLRDRHGALHRLKVRGYEHFSRGPGTSARASR